MTQNNDKKPENPNYPGFAESMRELTAIRTNNPIIATSSSAKYNEKGKRVLRQFGTGKKVFSETDQTKRGTVIAEMNSNNK